MSEVRTGGCSNTKTTVLGILSCGDMVLCWTVGWRLVPVGWRRGPELYCSAAFASIRFRDQRSQQHPVALTHSQQRMSHKAATDQTNGSKAPRVNACVPITFFVVAELTACAGGRLL